MDLWPASKNKQFINRNVLRKATLLIAISNHYCSLFYHVFHFIERILHLKGMDFVPFRMGTISNAETAFRFHGEIAQTTPPGRQHFGIGAVWKFDLSFFWNQYFKQITVSNCEFSWFSRQMFIAWGQHTASTQATQSKHGAEDENKKVK